VGERTVTPPMRAILAVGAVFVLIAGIQLYVFSEHTDDAFAWTIKPPLTAAFLGAFYLAACLIAVGSCRERLWENARVAVPGVLAFIWLILLATLIHLDKFHLDDSRFVPALAAWVWLVVYVLEPPILSLIYALQLRAPGGETPTGAEIPRWFRFAAAAAGALLVALGAVLFIAPETAEDLWPWQLTPLTARASAAWLVGEGLMGVMMGREERWVRVRWAVLSLVTLVLLLAIALLRYGDSFDSGSPAGIGYLVALALMFAGGAFGSLRAFTGAAGYRQ
jgi:peptidoglycan/LPS O-acetylase OafA/YrhL